jgi:hypothetical protein
MTDADRFKLDHDPYPPPKSVVGDKLASQYREREVAVGGRTDAPIQWPYVDHDLDLKQA